MRNYIPVFILSLVLVFGCEANKPLVKEQRLAQIENQLKAKKWKVNFDYAARLDVMNRPELYGNEFVELQGDSISIGLTFIGSWYQNQVNLTPTQARQIRINSKITDYEKTFDEKKRFYTLTMKVQDGREEFDISIRFYSNKKSVLTISSNFRTTVRYFGSLNLRTV